MSKNLDNKYFIILNKKEIIFSCLNNENKITFIKKHCLNDCSNNLFEQLEKFINDNLINIEKSLNDFIRKIYIIMDRDNNLSVNLSIKNNFGIKKISKKNINDLLIFLKYQFTKYNNDQKIIHIKITKSMIDGEEKNLSLVNETYKNLILEVRFECLSNQTDYILKKLFSNYQISVEKIFIAKYLRESFENQTDNLIYLANNIIIGKNNNEVSWILKKPNKQSFFERFFNFFD